MTNNDIIRQIRYIFNYTDAQMINIFESAGLIVSTEQNKNWLQKDEEENFSELSDQELAYFLNGFINEKRGKKEGPQPKAEKVLNNNIILRKLKIALNLKDIDMLEMFEKVDFKVSKHELSALFRKPTQSQYRECQNQFLRNFLYGMKMYYRHN